MALEHVANRKKLPGKCPAPKSLADAPRAEGFMPVEMFLTAVEPVWVWHSGLRSTVWSNGAARRLWGDAANGKLRFDPPPPAVKRLASLARRKTGGQWKVLLPLPGPSGDVLANCQVQRLELADGAAGLLIKAQVEAPPEPAKPAKARPAVSAAKSRKTVKSAKKPKAANPPAASPPPAAAPAPPPVPGKKRKFRPNAAGMAFLAGVSHDLRNPLGAILGFAELLRTARELGLTMVKVEEYAADIAKSAELALDLANDLLDWSRDGETHRPAPAQADVAATLADCVRLAAPLAGQAHLTIELAVPEALPPAPLSERALKQILLNVILNSVKFSAPGGQIKIKAARNKAGATVIAIDDTGGRSPSEPAALQAGRLAIPGAGIGLTMVKSLLKEAGAKLHRRKRPAGGMSTKLVFGDGLSGAS